MSWEVRTMASTTSCFNSTLYRKTMQRFWPLWALYALFWLFLIPFSLLSRYLDNLRWDSAETAARWLAESAYDLPGNLSAGVMVSCVFGVLCAMAAFGYLYSSRSACMMHALPLRREGLFTTQYLAGLSFGLLPHLGAALVTLLVEAALLPGDDLLRVLPSLGLWLLGQSATFLFFFSFAAFCAMFTGHILALPAFYGILNALAVGLLYLVNQVLASFVYGYVDVGRLTELCDWLSPFFRLGNALNVETVWSVEGAGADRITMIQFHGMGTVFIYALVGVVLTAAALWLYRRRQLEGAGDVVTVSWSKPIFKYGVGVCAALSVGQVFYQFFAYALPEGGWTLLVFLLLWGAVGYFVAEMLLQKSFWVFRGGWKGCVALCLVLTAFIAVMELDLTGYERRTPDPDRVVTATLYAANTAPYDSGDGSIIVTDPELIQAVVDLHRTIVDEQDIQENTQMGSSYESVTVAGGRVDVQTAGSSRVSISYTLIGGDVMQREYRIAYDADTLADPNSAAGKLSAFLNRPEIIQEQYFSAQREKSLADGSLRLTGIELEVWNTEKEEYETYPVPVGWREEVLQALQDDIAHGDLGRRYLLEDLERLENCYFTDLRINYEWSDPEMGGTSTRITLQTTSVETLDTLREAGVLDGVHVLETQLQRIIADMAYYD